MHTLLYGRKLDEEQLAYRDVISVVYLPLIELS